MILGCINGRNQISPEYSETLVKTNADSTELKPRIDTTAHSSYSAPSNNVSNNFQQLAAIFDVLDLDETGDLDLPEFKVGLSSIGINLSHEEAITLFESIADGLYVIY